jgi:hypothetical protein
MSSAPSMIAIPSRISAARLVQGGDANPVEVGEGPEAALLALGRQAGHGLGVVAGRVERHERGAGGTVFDELERPEDAEAAHLPTDGCRSASARSSGPITCSPRVRAWWTMPSSRMTRIEATAEAQASGCPE